MRFDDVIPQLEKALELLRAEARAIDARLASVTSANAATPAPKKRGRKPNAVAAAEAAPAAKPRKKPVWSEEARKAAAERSKKMWESRRGDQGQSDAQG